MGDGGQTVGGGAGAYAGRPLAFQLCLLTWAQANLRDLPWRRTLDPYAILVSEVMLQQTQVPRVVPRYESFLTRFSGFAALAEAPLPAVLAEWSGLGYNSRAVRLRQTAQAVVERHGGALPLGLAELLALPGIGPYTARALLIFATNADLAAVDTNVRRVLVHELGLSADLSPAGLQTVAEEVLPRGRSRLWHHALMDYGSTVVTAKVARVAGAPGARRQPAFAGSLRQARGRLVRRLLADVQGGSPVGDLARTGGTGGAGDQGENVVDGLQWRSVAWLAREASLTEEVVAVALAGLVADGMVTRGADGRFALAGW
jgi:A/G-specific adenine glycosylase